MSTDDFSKGLEKDIKDLIDDGLEEELRCKCGHIFKKPLARLEKDPLLVCPVCGLKTEVSLRAKKGL